MGKLVQRRIIVVPLIHNDRGEYLLCKMPENRGVFPGQWGLPGGGIEEGERMEDALKREIREELGLQVTDIEPLFFTDGAFWKSFPDGSRREIYMIFLVFSCQSVGENVNLNEEFEDYAWVARNSLQDYDLNVATLKTFNKARLIERY